MPQGRGMLVSKGEANFMVWPRGGGGQLEDA